MPGIYFHIPFCRKACHYCDFHFSTNLSTMDLVVQAMEKELQSRAEYLTEKKISSIYFGGGTPSVLPAAYLQSLIEKCRMFYDVSSDVEITLEVNPDDVTEVSIQNWKNIGVNRISIGIQTFDDVHLEAMNRTHTGQKAKDSLILLSNHFKNITADLMYGLVNDTIERLEQDVNVLLSFNIPHISTYCLTLEEKTAFGNWYKKGKLEEPNDDLSVAQYNFIIGKLSSEGFQHYEISNFGKEGFFSRHNSNYWNDAHYVGIGPGAHSYNGQSRQYNIENNVLYAKGIIDGSPKIEIEFLDEKTKLNEYILTRIRTIWGVDLHYIAGKYPQYLKLVTEPVDKLLSEGLVEKKENCIFLTSKGKHFSDRITRDLFLC